MTYEELLVRREELQRIFDNADEGSNARLISAAVLGLIEIEIARRTDKKE